MRVHLTDEGTRQLVEACEKVKADDKDWAYNYLIEGGNSVEFSTNHAARKGLVAGYHYAYGQGVRAGRQEGFMPDHAHEVALEVNDSEGIVYWNESNYMSFGDFQDFFGFTPKTDGRYTVAFVEKGE